MSEPNPRLPSRPSLDQLRKLAKELLRDFRDGVDAAVARVRSVIPRGANGRTLTLVDAQHVVAREHGYEGWAKLVHDIEQTRPPGLAKYERLADEIARAYMAGDAMAIRQINWTKGTAFVWDHDPERMRRRLLNWFASTPRSDELAVADARLLVAKQSGFDSWDELVRSLASPVSRPAARNDTPPKSPSYEVDSGRKFIEVRGPMTEHDWDEVFDVMKDLEITALRAAAPISDHALQRLARLDRVTSLDLSGAKRLTYAGLRHIAALPLRRLDLGGWGSEVDDEALKVLASLPELESISLMWAHRVTDAGVKHLAGCARLESVNLMGTHTGDGALRALRNKPRLRALQAGTRVTPSGLEALHEFPLFKNPLSGEVDPQGRVDGNEPPYIELHPAAFVRGGLTALVGLEGLTSLRLFSIDRAIPPIRATALQPLAGLSNIKSLWCDPADDAMVVIGTMPRLRELMCQDTDAGDNGWVALSNSRTLERIWGRRNANLGGRGFTALSKMPTLRMLGVNLARVDDASLARLAEFRALRELVPIGLGDAGFRHVARCTHLQTLTCMYTNDIGDAAIEHVADLRHLEKFYAGDTSITDRSLEVFGSLPELERVDLWSCIGVTNAGLAALARAPRLRHVSIETSPLVTRDAARLFPPRVTVRISG